MLHALLADAPLHSWSRIYKTGRLSALRNEKRAKITHTGGGFIRNSEDKVSEEHRRNGSGGSGRDVDLDVDWSAALLDAVPEAIAEAQAHHCAAEVDDAELVYTEWSPRTPFASSVPPPNEHPVHRKTRERRAIDNESGEQQKHEMEREQSDLKPEPLVLVSAFLTLDRGSKHSLHEYLSRLAPFGRARNPLVFFSNTPAFLEQILRLRLRGPSALNTPAARAEGGALMRAIENIARSVGLQMAPEREDQVSTQSRVGERVERHMRKSRADSRMTHSFLANAPLTRAFHVDLRELPSFRLYQKRVSEVLSTAAYYREFENTMVPEYCLAMHAKYDLVALALAHRRLLLPPGSTHIAWIDAGYFAGVGGLEGHSGSTKSTISTFALRPFPFLDPSRVAYTEVRPLGSWKTQALRRKDSPKHSSFAEGLQRSSRRTPPPPVRAFAFISTSGSLVYL